MRLKVFMHCPHPPPNGEYFFAEMSAGGDDYPHGASYHGARYDERQGDNVPHGDELPCVAEGCDGVMEVIYDHEVE